MSKKDLNKKVDDLNKKVDLCVSVGHPRFADSAGIN
jgi:hypothetical protein